MYGKFQTKALLLKWESTSLVSSTNSLMGKWTGPNCIWQFQTTFWLQKCLHTSWVLSTNSLMGKPTSPKCIWVLQIQKFTAEMFAQVNWFVYKFLNGKMDWP